jgi:hypothetical protein
MVTLLAFAPTAPVQQYAADWLIPPTVCATRDVHVTDPPDAEGVTVVRLPAFSMEDMTTIRSPVLTLVSAAVVNDVAVPEKLPDAGTTYWTRVGGVATTHPRVRSAG